MPPRPVLAALACLILLGAGRAPAQDDQPASPTGSLIDAQRALHATQDDLTRAQRAQSAADDKAAAAKRDYEAAQKSLERARAPGSGGGQDGYRAGAAALQQRARGD